MEQCEWSIGIGEERERRYSRVLLKFLVLSALAESDMHGYELMKFAERVTGGWRPSPGMLYPLLKELKEEGLIEVARIGERSKVYRLTRRGAEYYLSFSRELVGGYIVQACMVARVYCRALKALNTEDELQRVRRFICHVIKRTAELCEQPL